MKRVWLSLGEMNKKQMNKLKINFDKKIYSKDAIDRAIKDYKNLAKVELEEVDENIQAFISVIDEDLKDVIQDEFSNHVLGYMKIIRRNE